MTLCYAENIQHVRVRLVAGVCRTTIVVTLVTGESFPTATIKIDVEYHHKASVLWISFIPHASVAKSVAHTLVSCSCRWKRFRHLYFVMQKYIRLVQPICTK